MNENHFNIVIIGSGVIGLAIAERLSRNFSNILVVEKEKSFGYHTSSRNSEVIHSGFYYPENSLKAKLCIKGNSLSLNLGGAWSGAAAHKILEYSQYIYEYFIK